MSEHYTTGEWIGAKGEAHPNYVCNYCVYASTYEERTREHIAERHRDKVRAALGVPQDDTNPAADAPAPSLEEEGLIDE